MKMPRLIDMDICQFAWSRRLLIFNQHRKLFLSLFLAFKGVYIFTFVYFFLSIKPFKIDVYKHTFLSVSYKYSTGVSENKLVVKGDFFE